MFNFCEEMILNVKAKEDFEKWLFSNDILIKDGIYDETYLTDVFEELPLNLQYSSIIEWFDSVDIYISINYVDFYDELRNDTGFETYVTNKGLSVKFRSVSSRQEAIKQAIKKANEIYNNKN